MCHHQINSVVVLLLIHLKSSTMFTCHRIGRDLVTFTPDKDPAAQKRCSQNMLLTYFDEHHMSVLPRVREMSAKNKNFLKSKGKVREFKKKMSGNFGHLTHVSELSADFVMALFLD